MAVGMGTSVPKDSTFSDPSEVWRRTAGRGRPSLRLD